MAKRRGIYHAVQYYNHPITGEPLFNDDMLSVASNHKCIKKCYYIIHDADTYKQSDIDATRSRLKKEYIEKQNEFVNEDGTVSISCDAYVEQEMATTYSYIKIGEVKPKHIHIVISTGKSAIDTADLALWFGVPENLIDIIPKGRGDKAFYDCLLYLTHESAQAVKDGKHRYSREDVFCFGADAIGFEEELAEYEKMMEEYGRVLSAKDAMYMDVLLKGKTLRQCEADDPLLYADEMEKLRKLRGQYLMGCNPPPYRLNFFVEGQGGIGKGLLSRALARALYPNLMDDDEIFFIVGANGVGFEGYDGQPVVIWNDKRSYELIRMLGGVGNVFDVFDTFPTKSKQNVKYSCVNLINAVNIVNADQPYKDFLDGLAGEYTDRDGNFHKAEDKSQSYRRFPMMLILHEEDYDMMINKGYIDGTRNFMEYYAYNHIRGNFARISQKCHDRAIARKYEDKAIAPVLDQHNAIVEKLSTQDGNDIAALDAEFADYGTIPEPPKEVRYTQGTMETDADGFMRVTEEMLAELPFD